MSTACLFTFMTHAVHDISRHTYFLYNHLGGSELIGLCEDCCRRCRFIFLSITTDAGDVIYGIKH